MAFSQDEIMFQNDALKKKRFTKSGTNQSDEEAVTDYDENVNKCQTPLKEEKDNSRDQHHFARLLNLARTGNCAQTYLQY